MLQKRICSLFCRSWDRLLHRLFAFYGLNQILGYVYRLWDTLIPFTARQMGTQKGGVFQKQNPPTCPETWPPTWSPPQSCWLIEADGGVLDDHTAVLVSFSSIITNSTMTSSRLSVALQVTACIRIIPELLKVKKLIFFIIWKSGSIF